MEAPPFIGDWYRERLLGKGSYGTVNLWKHKKSGSNVAIKTFILSEEDDPSSVARQKERWEYEIDLLTNIVKNDNIVRAVKVEPAFLSELTRLTKNKLPVLCLEFCEGGDLRRTLDSSENTCCGLKENEVRAVLKALRNAISYLHQLKITHRDLKPENIVLKHENGRVVYKLTDLGVAKELDRNSLNASFVGTMEYLAPELLHGGKYSNSVDYWSFGVIAFEIICGMRPFLPHCPIARWLVYAQKKNSDHICITEDNQGNYTYHKTVLPENRTCRKLLKHLEKWLSIALEWNPKQRGYAFESAVKNDSSTKSVQFAEKPEPALKIFTLLDEALEKRLLTVFSLHNYQFYEFEITENTTMNELLLEISKETTIPVPEIEAFLPLEQQMDRIDEQTKPIFLFNPDLSDSPMLYVLKSGQIYNQVVPPQIPKSIQDVFRDAKVKLKAHTLRHFARNSVFFVQNEQKLYATLMKAIKTYALCLNDRIIKSKPSIIQMLRNSFTLKGAMNEFNENVEHTKTKIPEVLSQSYFDQCSKVESNINALCEASERISRRYDSALRRSQEAINAEILKSEIEDVYNTKVLNVQFNLIRTQIAERKPLDEKSHINILNSVYGCLKKRDKILLGTNLSELSQKLVHVKTEMNEIMKAAEMAESTKNALKRALCKLSMEHQNTVWSLVPATKIGEMATKNHPEYLPDFEGILPPVDFKVGDAVTSLRETHGNKVLCFGEGNDTKSLLSDCQTLILTTDEILNEGIKFMQEIESM
ncbi:inhibitor of nuclear factor kappa-B kinase subunit alpha [Culicoides brevitarsis]|uniref:inhibitor of nuclear factor kappa-B kinase subunit alpha n=1 Tax=Culicoides brevitarsis TaxID=469753 RepID=UPI00307BB70F